MLGFLSLLSTVIFLFWMRWRIKHRKLLDISDKLPGPPAIPILGNAWQMMGPPEELANTIGNFRRDYGDICRVWIGLDLNIFVSDPDDIKTLLSNSNANIKGPQYKYVADYCGAGVLSGSGNTWRISRKTLLPNYGKKALESYGDIINAEANETVQRLRARVGGKTFDIYDDIVLGTTYTVCRTLMGLTKEQTLNLPHLNSVFLRDAHDLYFQVFKRITTWYLQIDPIYWMTNDYQKQTEMLKKIYEMGDSIIKHRLTFLDSMNEDRKREVLNSGGDNKYNTELSIVDRLILSNEITSKEEILKEIFSVFTSSQEATGKISSYILLMMAYYPDCQEKLYAEIKEVLGDSDRDVTDDDLKQMPYLDMVFKEVVRLFPSGVILQRTLADDITISRATLPAGSSITIPIYHMQRDKRFWNNPNAFDPDRFSQENTKLRNPNCYIPFSYGPMDCMGRYYANKIVKTVCVKVVREYRLSSPETFEDLRLALAVSVCSVNGYPVQLLARN